MDLVAKKCFRCHMYSMYRCARETGYVCTLTGRRRHLPEINNSRNAALKAQAERQAVNSVVQVCAPQPGGKLLL